MRTVTIEQRRATLVSRHRLTGDAETPEAAVDAVLALHATDPATVYLSVLARSRRATLSDMHTAMYGRRALVRWMAMRRTLFVFARDDIPMIQSAVSTPLAAVLRRRLLSLLERNGIEPPVAEDLPDWLHATEERVEQSLWRRGSATGPELRGDEPNLHATIPARTRSEQSQGLTSPLLTLMSAQGLIVRSTPIGAWTTRTHRWEPSSAWWPRGIPHIDPTDARIALARRWLERFGPATIDDLEWWTGWNKTTTHATLARLDLEEVDLHGRPGIDLRGAEPVTPAEPDACLLPCLDSTPMGWKHRDWFTPSTPPSSTTGRATSAPPSGGTVN